MEIPGKRNKTGYYRTMLMILLIIAASLTWLLIAADLSSCVNRTDGPPASFRKLPEPELKSL
jgi:hypothetical protein